MKRIAVLTLALILLLGLCACGKEEQEETLLGRQKFDTLVAGFGKADVTPQGQVYLTGNQNDMERLTTGIKDEFFALTTALSDTQGNTLLIIVADIAFGRIELVDQIRAMVLERYGIPGEYVLLGGTHTHSGPAYRGEAGTTAQNLAYLEHWRSGVMESIEKALLDRQPAEIQIGRGETEGETFVRRFFRADGCLTGSGLADRYPVCDEPIVSYESEGDEEAQFVKLIREDGKDILIAQWQCHATLYSGTNSTVASTDFVGPLRLKMEEELGCHVMYMQGCAGNMNPNTRAPFTTEHPTVADVDTKAERIADAFIEMCSSEGFFADIAAGDIALKQVMYSDSGTYRTGLWEVELTSVSIGDLSLVTIPVEMHAETGIAIKEGTPYEMTLLMGYTNGIGGYVATRESFHNGGYGVVDGRANENSADNMVKIWLDSLKELHG